MHVFLHESRTLLNSDICSAIEPMSPFTSQCQKSTQCSNKATLEFETIETDASRDRGKFVTKFAVNTVLYITLDLICILCHHLKKKYRDIVCLSLSKKSIYFTGKNY
jgi:NADH:ubiquinone oxidoreductase subunit 3 (subunit A)